MLDLGNARQVAAAFKEKKGEYHSRPKFGTENFNINTYMCMPNATMCEPKISGITMSSTLFKVGC